MSQASRQPSLSDEESPAARCGGLTVAEVLEQTKPQTRQQATFQRLIRQIGERRASITLWHDYRARYNQRLAKELHPLHDKLRKRKILMAQLLDRHFDTPGAIRGKKQRENLGTMIFELCSDLLQNGQDDLLIALHDKHADLSFEESQAFAQAASIEMIGQMFGVMLDEDEVCADDDMDTLFFKAAKKASSEAAQQPKPPRKKSARAAAAEEKRLAAEKEISQSVRDVYRKLASTLHPDRQSKDLTAGQKTSLMQRVNRAYDEGNLLELLNIQLEIEQIDADHLSGLPDARVAHYNKVLREQLKELDSEIDLLTAPFYHLLSSTQTITPDKIDRAMNDEIRDVKEMLCYLDEDLQTYENPAVLAKMLRRHRPAGGPEMFDDLAFMLDEMTASGEPPPKQPRKSRKK